MRQVRRVILGMEWRCEWKWLRVWRKDITEENGQEEKECGV